MVGDDGDGELLNHDWRRCSHWRWQVGWCSFFFCWVLPSLRGKVRTGLIRPRQLLLRGPEV